MDNTLSTREAERKMRSFQDWEKLGACFFLLCNDHPKEQDIQEAIRRIGITTEAITTNVHSTAIKQALQILPKITADSKGMLSKKRECRSHVHELLRQIQYRYHSLPQGSMYELKRLKQEMEQTMKELTEVLF